MVSTGSLRLSQSFQIARDVQTNKKHGSDNNLWRETLLKMAAITKERLLLQLI